jgi:hypothetical protein
MRPTKYVMLDAGVLPIVRPINALSIPAVLGRLSGAAGEIRPR